MKGIRENDREERLALPYMSRGISKPTPFRAKNHLFKKKKCTDNKRGKHIFRKNH